MNLFNHFTSIVTKATGSAWVFSLALLVVLFGDHLHLDVNMIATITPFLMVFIIQHSQNKDTKALHLKIDELIRSHEAARNEMAGIESKTEKEIENLKV